MCLPQVKGSRVAEAMVELGREGAATHRPVSQVSSHQVDSRTGEMMLHEISYFAEMHQGLVSTQHCLFELKERERECELKKQ
jgi:hypothetical protein